MNANSERKKTRAILEGALCASVFLHISALPSYCYPASFIEEDPGRQSISGSFQPIDVGEWAAQAYLGATEHFFSAIAAKDHTAVLMMIKEGVDINCRDQVGRSPLHLALLTKAEEIACDLIDAGARMTARLVDGRTSLHLAAQGDLRMVVRKLLQRSDSNKEAAGKEDTEKDSEMPRDLDRPSSEDDWSSEDDGVLSADDSVGDEDDDKDEDDDDNMDEEDGDGRPNKRDSAAAVQPEPEGNAGDLPEDEADLPDILDVNLPDWDLSFTPLCHAIVSGSLSVVEQLLDAGADAKLIPETKNNKASLHPLTLTLIIEDEDRASKMAERLLLAGATSSAADQSACTIFYQAVIHNNIGVVSTLLKHDPNAQTVLNFPLMNYNNVVFPLVIAIDKRAYSVVALLLAHGAKINFTEEDVSRAKAVLRRVMQCGIHMD